MDTRPNGLATSLEILAREETGPRRTEKLSGVTGGDVNGDFSCQKVDLHQEKYHLVI